MRLGDLDALIAEVDESISNIAFTSPYQDEIERVRDGMERVRDCIDNAPTIDAVEVVRCKNCKYSTEELALRKDGIWCKYWGTDPDPNDFCSHGKRKTDDAKGR